MLCKGPARAQPSHNSRGCQMNSRILYAFEMSLIDYLLPLGFKRRFLLFYIVSGFYYVLCSNRTHVFMSIIFLNEYMLQDYPVYIF